MKITRDDIMGMPITLEIFDISFNEDIFSKVFSYFEFIDKKFSTYKKDSEISLINAGAIKADQYSLEVKEILRLSENTKKDTGGYFDILTPEGKLAPLGLVKGWAIQKAVETILNAGIKNFYINAGGDIQAIGKNSEGEYLRVGIENPFKKGEIVKVVELKNAGMATSGTYIRGQHIYNPFARDKTIDDIISLTVIGPNIYEADRFATAAFAMGKSGIEFIERLEGFEGYMIDKNGIAISTSGFDKIVLKK